MYKLQIIGGDEIVIEMKILSSREEWLANRFNGIGGSEISAVVGCNPYMSNTELWEYKTGRKEREDISDKPYVQYGIKAEEHLRELFKLDFPEYEVGYKENNSFHNSKYPWALASLDGWLRDDKGRIGVWECKTTNILQSMQREKWKEKIPQNYYCQVLMYMAVLEADFAVLKAQLKSEFNGELYIQTKHYRIERSDVQEDIDYIMKKGSEFWEYVQKDIYPPLILPEI